jgi:hypothetical protein
MFVALFCALAPAVVPPAGFGAEEPGDAAWQHGLRQGREGGECAGLVDGFMPPRGTWRLKPSPGDDYPAASPCAVWRAAGAAAAPPPVRPRPASAGRDGRDTHLRIGVLLI